MRDYWNDPPDNDPTIPHEEEELLVRLDEIESVPDDLRNDIAELLATYRHKAERECPYCEDRQAEAERESREGFSEDATMTEATTPSGDAPERIYLVTDEELFDGESVDFNRHEILWLADYPGRVMDEHDVEYVRVDLYAAAIAEQQRLREVVEVYADERNWTSGPNTKGKRPSFIRNNYWEDGYDPARHALAETAAADAPTFETCPVCHCPGVIVHSDGTREECAHCRQDRLDAAGGGDRLQQQRIRVQEAREDGDHEFADLLEQKIRIEQGGAS